MDVPTNDDPGSRLRRTRLETQLTKVDLARAIGVTDRALWQIEEGRSQASLPTLKRLAEKLNVSVAYLGGFENLPEETLPQKIKKARMWHGMTIKEFAAAIGVNEHSVGKWEKGKQYPSEDNITVLNKYIKILV